MKFLTFKTKNDNEIRFGFKSYEKVIDIGLAAKWLYEKKNDNSFINIPLTLHRALEEWDQNFTLLNLMKKLILLKLLA